jgi:hypothetical protein
MFGKKIEMPPVSAEKGDQSPEPVESPAPKEETGGGFMQRINGPAKKTMGILAPLLGAAFGLPSDQAKEPVTPPEDSTGGYHEVLAEIDPNKTTEQIINDFPGLSLNPERAGLASYDLAYAAVWREILQAYSDGYLIYEGKIGPDQFSLGHKDEGEGFIIIDIHDILMAESFGIRQKGAAKDTKDNSAAAQPIRPLAAQTEGDKWWQEESKLPDPLEEEYRLMIEQEFAEVSDISDPESALDLLPNIKEQVSPERLARIEQLILDKVPSDLIGKVVNNLNITPYGSDFWNDDERINNVLEILVSQWQNRLEREGEEGH